MSFERPRIRTDGPGGPDVKQGARIACLDCRTAKIRCSAPTDGKVPCKRCARHGKECVFEKHRRGRKPGRANGGHYASSSEPSSEHYQQHNHHRFGSTQLFHYEDGERVKRQELGQYAAYRKEDSESCSTPTLPHPNYQSVHAGPSSASASHEATSVWSPASSSPQGTRLASLSSSVNMRSVSPVRSHHDNQSGHSRSLSSNTSLPMLREANNVREQHHHHHHHHLQSVAHPSYLPSLQSSHSSSSPLLSSQPPPPISPRRQGSNIPPFGLYLGPVAPSFGVHASSGGSGMGGPGLTPGSVGSGVRLHSNLNTPLTMPRFNLVEHQLTPGGLLPSSTLAATGSSPKSWLDFPSSPGSRPLFSPSHPSILSTTTPSGGSSAPYWPGAAIVSSHSHKRKPTGDYFSGVLTTSSIGKDEATEGNARGNRNRAQTPLDDREESLKRRRLERQGEDQAGEDRMRSRRRKEDDDDDDDEEEEEDDDDDDRNLEEEGEEEEEVDQLNEDEVGGEHNDDVLATPLSLLAHASDAAATLKENRGEVAERRNSFGAKGMGAATMGLVSPPVPKLAPPRRWFDSGRLPHLGLRFPATPSHLHRTLSPIVSRPQSRDYLRTTSASRSTSMAPPYGPVSRPTVHHPSSSRTDTPPSLGAIGRSRSYTTVENVNRPVSTFSPPRTKDKDTSQFSRPIVTEDERRAEVLGEGVYLGEKKLEETEQGNSITPSTLDHEAWEYRDGRARTRKSFSAASSGPGSSQSEDSNRLAAVNMEASTSRSSSSANNAAASSNPSLNSMATVNAPMDNARPELQSGEKSIQPRRWQILKRRIGEKQSRRTSIVEKEDNSDTEAESEESETLGASHRDFFSLSIFHSKMDNETDMDPVQHGILELRDVERLFDIFFARINPLLNLLDPFLHSVTYVRTRSALLTTVVTSLAARLSNTGRDAELAVRLERFWRHNLLPEVLIGGYKSVELSQAFLILSLYHKPTNRLADDRSWQYLGFAIRISTEVGVNRITQPNESVRDNEQVRRRMRNRVRLWMSLFLSDRALGFQTGRPWTISEDEVITNSNLWHREDFALPQDARLVGSIKLTRMIGEYSQALKDVIQAESNVVGPASNPYQWKEDVNALIHCLSKAIIDLERWRDIWCGGSLDDRPDGSAMQAVANSLEKWQSEAKRRYFYGRLNLCSRVLQSLERIRSVELAAAEAKGALERVKGQMEEIDNHIQRLSLDAWQCSMDMMETLLEKGEENDASAAPNQTAVMAIYGALAALRLTKSSQRNSLGQTAADQEATIFCCKNLAKTLIEAGQMPKHRNGVATSYGVYLDGILTLWESTVMQEVPLPTSPLPSSGGGGKASDDDDAKGAIGTIQATKKKPKEETDDVASLSDERALLPVQQAVAAAAAATIKKHVSSSSHHHTSSAPSLPTPSKDIQQALQQQHTVGDELWGNATSHTETTLPDGVVASDPEAMDRMWDYLTTYPDPSSGFPLSIWQPHSNWPAPSLPRSTNMASML